MFYRSYCLRLGLCSILGFKALQVGTPFRVFESLLLQNHSVSKAEARCVVCKKVALSGVHGDVEEVTLAGGLPARA